jgi:hypothetical protein
MYDRRRHSRRAGDQTPAERERRQDELAETWGRTAPPIVELVDPTVPTKRCRTCGADQVLDAFGKQVGGTFGKRAHCRRCIQQLEKARRRRIYLRTVMIID